MSGHHVARHVAPTSSTLRQHGGTSTRSVVRTIIGRPDAASDSASIASVTSTRAAFRAQPVGPSARRRRPPGRGRDDRHGDQRPGDPMRDRPPSRHARRSPVRRGRARRRHRPTVGPPDVDPMWARRHRLDIALEQAQRSSNGGVGGELHVTGGPRDSVDVARPAVRRSTPRAGGPTPGGPPISAGWRQSRPPTRSAPTCGRARVDRRTRIGHRPVVWRRASRPSS